MNKKILGLIAFAIVIAGAVILILINDRPEEGNYVAIEPIAQHSNGASFVGSSSCAECHPKIYESHLQTAHFNSSGETNLDRVKGNFDINGSIFKLNDSIEFRMLVRDGQPYQDIFSVSKDSVLASLAMDVFIGSGTKGQTYLNWQDNALFQLQISYFAPNSSWINSPGYPKHRLASIRPIQQRCLECHVTYAKNTRSFNRRNIYEKSKMIYGIDCERCHGPSFDHVKFHKENPDTKGARNIQTIADLGRQQRLDACALCHSGIRTRSNSNAFEFVLGDSLRRFSQPDYSEKDLKNLDVHGNQYGLLTASKCFKQSEVMDCNTCHNPHKKERNDVIAFNNRCVSCHNSSPTKVVCSKPEQNQLESGDNCIQCHMPLVESKSMQIQTSGSILESVSVRTHLIGIYSDSLVKKTSSIKLKTDNF